MKPNVEAKTHIILDIKFLSQRTRNKIGHYLDHYKAMKEGICDTSTLNTTHL